MEVRAKESESESTGEEERVGIKESKKDGAKVGVKEKVKEEK